MKNFLRIATCAALALLLPGVRAQVAAGGANQEPGITRQQAEEILQELRQIRQLLERQQQQLAGPAGQDQDEPGGRRDAGLQERAGHDG
jgi:hypothetical protein